MAITFDQAIAALGNTEYQTLDGLKQLVAQISVQATGQASNATTLLYSGSLGDVPAWQVANKLAESASGKVVVIGQTPVANFLEDPRFLSALEDAAGTSDTSALKSILDGVANLDGTRTPGMWDIASKNLASAASGDVRTLTPLAEQGKTFIQTELPALLDNRNVTSINGISITNGVRHHLLIAA